MGAEHVNSFLIAAQRTWLKALGSPMRLWKTGEETLTQTPSELTVVVEVVGTVQGTVLYSIDGPAMRAIVRKMMDNRTLSSDLSFGHMKPEDVAEGAFLQLSQMISTEAVTRLRKTGLTCMVSSARLLKPKGTSLGTAGGEQLQVAFRSPVGNLKIRIHQDLVRAGVAKAA